MACNVGLFALLPCKNIKVLFCIKKKNNKKNVLSSKKFPASIVWSDCDPAGGGLNVQSF